MNDPLRTFDDYELFIYTLADRSFLLEEIKKLAL